MSSIALVTGAAGFIGSHLSEELVRKGYIVRGIDSFSDYYDRQLKRSNVARLLGSRAFTLVEEDILQTRLDTLLDGVSVVFHCAAQPGVRRSWGSEFERYVLDNILATQRLLEALKDRPLQRLVFSSSSSVYGDAEAYPTPETAVPQPRSPYGVSKLAAEHLCFLYWKNWGIPTVMLRYFTVYGPRQRPDMAFARFVRSALTGEGIEVYGDGSQERDFTFVGDIVRANLLAAEGVPPGSVVNIGQGRSVQLGTVLRLLESLTGRELKIRYREKQPGDVVRTCADSGLATRLGLVPQVSIEEGLALQVAAARAVAFAD